MVRRNEKNDMMRREIQDVVRQAEVENNQSQTRRLVADDNVDSHKHDGNDDNIKCLSFEKDVVDLVNSTKQVFIAMPAKVAGSSLGSFVMDHCMKDYKHLEPGFWGWYFNRQDKIQELMTLNIGMPSILTSHLGRPSALLNLVKAASDESLIVYVHRQENDRLLSGIKQVGQRLCRKQFKLLEDFEDKVHFLRKQCVIDEEVFLEILKRPSRLEIRNGVYKALTCDVFDAIKDNRPNMVVLNYKDSDKLQYALAKQHCPQILDDSNFPIHINEASKKGDIMVKLKNEYGVVSLEDWTQTKKRVIEFAYGTTRHYDCLGDLKKMERKLFSCDDGIVQL